MDLQHSLERFFVAYDQAGMKIRSLQDRDITFLLRPKAVYAGRKWQLIAAHGDVQVPCGCNHGWRTAEQWDWYKDC